MSEWECPICGGQWSQNSGNDPQRHRAECPNLHEGDDVIAWGSCSAAPVTKDELLTVIETALYMGRSHVRPTQGDERETYQYALITKGIEALEGLRRSS
jgi:hypothetical protein